MSRSRIIPAVVVHHPSTKFTRKQVAALTAEMSRAFGCRWKVTRFVSNATVSPGQLILASADEIWVKDMQAHTY
jgi:hypothetical protein